ncbi:probable RNA-binding protein EIF1AD [Argiope bruennichi]|uniref:probable RNA-binding protein EIF1AD n=1 Tax=Argiope bruennichi TaxID=94029 RepID=UPI002494DECC|nr:probable RNA-binding protein EIF1AD [Argiope bruennichi]XP_055950624.1 probable RNA-binding protein EIF1AD [Argiope bruennichi]
MTSVTKKKYVKTEVLNTYDLPTNEQKIVKVLQSCGNNLHEVITPEGDQFLASMPTKFRKYVWIKRGDFVVVDPILEGVKVKGEIAIILRKDQIKHYKEQGVWPKAFSDPNEKVVRRSSNSDDDDDLFVNTNRCDYPTSSSEEEEEEEDDEESDDDEAG